MVLTIKFNAMNKVTIEIEIPEGIDLEHMHQSVTDAINFSGNVTFDEFDLVEKIIITLQEAK